MGSVLQVQEYPWYAAMQGQSQSQSESEGQKQKIKAPHVRNGATVQQMKKTVHFYTWRAHTQIDNQAYTITYARMWYDISQFI